MKTTTILIFLTCLSLLGASESCDQQVRSLLADSSSWPAFVQPKGKLELPNGKIVESWQRGVLIRLEDEAPHVLVDFGREGIHRLEISETNLSDAVASIRSGKLTKAGANYLQMLGPPKLFHPKDGKSVPVTMEEAASWKHLLFLYMPDSGLDWNLLESLLDENGPRLDAYSVKPILMPLDPYSDGEIIEPIVERDLNIALMHHFLCRSFIDTLQHFPNSRALMVLTDLNGKVFAQSRDVSVSGLNSILSILD